MAKKPQLRRYVIMASEGFQNAVLTKPEYQPSSGVVALTASPMALRANSNPQMRVLDTIQDNGPKLVEMPAESELSLRLERPGPEDRSGGILPSAVDTVQSAQASGQENDGQEGYRGQRGEENGGKYRRRRVGLHGNDNRRRRRQGSARRAGRGVHRLRRTRGRTRHDRRERAPAAEHRPLAQAGAGLCLFPRGLLGQFFHGNHRREARHDQARAYQGHRPGPPAHAALQVVADRPAARA